MGFDKDSVLMLRTGWLVKNEKWNNWCIENWSFQIKYITMLLTTITALCYLSHLSGDFLGEGVELMSPDTSAELAEVSEKSLEELRISPSICNTAENYWMKLIIPKYLYIGHKWSKIKWNLMKTEESVKSLNSKKINIIRINYLIEDTSKSKPLVTRLIVGQSCTS